MSYTQEELDNETIDETLRIVMMVIDNFDYISEADRNELKRKILDEFEDYCP